MGKKSAPPPAPDYAAIARQQAVLDKTAANEQTVTNRPNQNTPWGSTNWAQGADGKWTENVNLNSADQAALDQQRQFDAQKQGIASGLLGKAGDTLGQPLDMSALPDLKDFDLSQLAGWQGLDLGNLPQGGDYAGMDPGFGAVQEVQDAMMGRMAPARSQARESEIQRLKNQGIPENSEAFQRALTRLDQGDTDANQQALLGATSAYGDIFNRGLSKAQGLDSQRGAAVNERGLSSQFNNTMRGQQFDQQGRAAQLSGLLRQQNLAEQQQVRQSPLDDFMKLTQGINPTMPPMPNFMSGTGYQAENQMGAAKDQYSAAMDAYNAQQARSGGIMSGLFGLAGSALGGPLGGMLGKKLGGG